MPSRVPYRMTLKERALWAARWIPVPPRRAQRKKWGEAAMIAAATGALAGALDAPRSRRELVVATIGAPVLIGSGSRSGGGPIPYTRG